MSKKYAFTNKTIDHFGVTLKQIIRISDNEVGGYIQSENNLSHSDECWVYGNAWVHGNAEVYGDARVYGNAKVSGNAWVSGDARVYGDAKVHGNAEVHGNAWVSGNAEVSKRNEIFLLTGFSQPITLTLTWGHVGCLEFNPMELDSINYDDRVSRDEFDAIKSILRIQYAFMLSKI